MMNLSRPAAGARRAAAALALALGAAACHTPDLLQVDDIDIANPGSVQTRAALPVLLAGAVGDVQSAFSGNGDTQITASAEFTDEMLLADTYPSRQEFDQRGITPTNPTNTAIFRALLRGYASAVRAQEAYARLDPATVGRAEAYNLEALAILLAAENYCSGVPFSKLTDDGASLFGKPLARDTMLVWAAAVADSAAAVLQSVPATTPGIATQASFAAVLRGRALLDLGQFAQAASAVAAVPTNFVFQFEHSANTIRENNGIYSLTFLDPRMSVADVEGTNGLPYRSDADPRVPEKLGSGQNGEPARGFDGSPMYLQLKYPSRAANVVAASGIEARLIEAEAALQASDAPGALDILNTLRSSAGVAGLAPLNDAGTPDARVNQLFKERAYWLWLTSHRLGDLRRLVRQYGRLPESVFPTGAYTKGGGGGLYGADVNFPVPLDELNNPNFSQCIDRGA